jgi:hypothetical protein
MRRTGDRGSAPIGGGAMTPISADDLEPRDKPPKGRRIARPPGRDAPLSEVREWLSVSAGLPPVVRVDTVLRPGRDPEDPVTLALSNGLKLRCSHQARLQQPRTLQAFLASESDGIAQPAYLSPSEVGEFYTQLCRLGNAAARVDPVADLAERLTAFVALCDVVPGSIRDVARRYVSIEAVRMRPAFDRGVAMGMTNGTPQYRPALLADDRSRYVRASEWAVYLRFVVGWTVHESELVARMTELGSERVEPQAWNADRSHKTHLVFYAIPKDL